MTRTGSSPSPARTVFFGSGGFAVPILERLAAMPERGARRRRHGTGSAERACAARSRRRRSRPVPRRSGSRVLRPERLRDPEAVAAIAALEPDLGVLADYGRIVPRQILDLPAHGILNVHPSLLPRHRGATPIPATILAGDATAGVSIIRMDDGIDTGPLVAQHAWPLEGNERAPDLESDAARRGAELLALTLEPWRSGEIQAVPQDEADATTTRPFRREDGRLDPAGPRSSSSAGSARTRRGPGASSRPATGASASWPPPPPRPRTSRPGR